jgi:hypothetical protein
VRALTREWGRATAAGRSPDPRSCLSHLPQRILARSEGPRAPAILFSLSRVGVRGQALCPQVAHPRDAKRDARCSEEAEQ